MPFSMPITRASLVGLAEGGERISFAQFAHFLLSLLLICLFVFFQRGVFKRFPY